MIKQCLRVSSVFKLSHNSSLGRVSMWKGKAWKKKKAKFVYDAKSFKCHWSASQDGQTNSGYIKGKNNVTSFR